MSAFFPRRFTNPEFLKTIASENLAALLAPHRDYLAEHGLVLPGNGKGKINYEALIAILVKGDLQMPKALVDSLYYVHEMSTPDDMNALLESAPKGLFDFTGTGEPTPGDVAIVAWLKDPAFVEERHSQRFLVRSKTFVVYQGSASKRRKSLPVEDKTCRAIEAELDDWFSEKRRGRGSRFFVHPRGNEVWFLVRHGDPSRREGTYDDGKAGSVYYRPEKYDVLIYDCDLDRLAVHAATEGEKALYKRTISKLLFGAEEYFRIGKCFALAPLQKDGAAALNCDKVDGIEWIKLKEVEMYRGHALRVVYKAEDLFLALGKRANNVLNSGDLWRASFHVKFSDCQTPRVLNLRPPAGAGYTRDSDRLLLEEWMRDKHFLLTSLTNEKAETTVAGV